MPRSNTRSEGSVRRRGVLARAGRALRRVARAARRTVGNLFNR